MEQKNLFFLEDWCGDLFLSAIFFKVGFSSSKQISFYLPQLKPFKSDEKYFLIYLKSSFRSQDI